MKMNATLSDKVILIEIGKRIQSLRIAGHVTQSQLAEKTKVSQSTIARMEQGYPIKTDSLISVMREVGLLENLEIAFPQQEIRPMDLVQKNVKKRKRASSSKKEERKNDWKWGDEK